MGNRRRRRSPLMVALAVVFFPVTILYFMFVWPFTALAKQRRARAAGRPVEAAVVDYADALPGYSLAYSYDDVSIFTPAAMISRLPLHDLADDPALELRQEPDNKYDPLAVALYWHGHQLGYLHRNRLQEMSNSWIRRGWPVYADFARGAAAGDDSWATISMAFYRPEGKS